ncbi:hypothetical protein ACT8ZR_09365 [Neobacillus sp. M.A.Huq-85]
MNNLNVNFKYKFAENYNPVYSNGVFGGPSPRGELVMNFFFERTPIPYNEVRKVNEFGQITDEIIATPKDEIGIVRYVSNGVVMNLQQAKSFHEWLGQHIQQMERGVPDDGR